MSDAFSSLPQLPPLGGTPNPFGALPSSITDLSSNSDDALFDQLLITVQDDPEDSEALLIDLSGPEFSEDGSPDEDKRIFYMLNMAANSLGYELTPVKG